LARPTINNYPALFKTALYGNLWLVFIVPCPDASGDAHGIHSAHPGRRIIMDSSMQHEACLDLYEN